MANDPLVNVLQPRGGQGLSGAASAFAQAQAQAAAAAHARDAQFRRERDRERPYSFERRDSRAPQPAHMDARALHHPHNAAVPMPGQPDYTQVRAARSVPFDSVANYFYFTLFFIFVLLSSFRLLEQ